MSTNNTEVHFTTDAQYKKLAEEQAAKARAHATAETLARAFGDFAPDPAPHESSHSYRRRLASNFQKHSSKWKDTDLKLCAPDAFGPIEQEIYADAAREVREPTNIPDGKLVQRITTDATGRQMSRFFGAADAAWRQFTFHPNELRCGRIVLPR